MSRGDVSLLPSAFDPPAGSAFDWDANGRLIYIGQAKPGSAKSAGAWAIMKLVYSGSGQLTDILWADGNGLFDNIWNNRAALSYS